MFFSPLTVSKQTPTHRELGTVGGIIAGAVETLDCADSVTAETFATIGPDVQQKYKVCFCILFFF